MALGNLPIIFFKKGLSIVILFSDNFGTKIKNLKDWYQHFKAETVFITIDHLGAPVLFNSWMIQDYIKIKLFKLK